jgi:pantetheine-phosphate adenylyltransferase
MNKQKKIAVFAGTFDPFTLGHLSLVERGLALFDEIIVAIGINLNKKTFFSPEQREKMITRLFENEPRVRVRCYEGLTIDLAASEKANFILRGIRTASDFDYERTIANANRKLSGIETVILFSEPEKEHISSTVVRELLEWGKPVNDFVPEGMILN